MKQRELCRSYLEQFPNTPSRTLALKAYNENPGIWRTVEATRTMFRSLRGAQGDKNRKYADPKFIRQKQLPGDPFGRLPKPMEHFNHWDALKIGGPAKVLCIHDLHVPYFDKQALTVALKFGQLRKADLILLNGDIADCHRISKFNAFPTREQFVDEVVQVRQFLGVLRELFPDARIIYKLGNHEERYEHFMLRKAPELLNIAEFSFNAAFHLDQFDVELVCQKRPIKIGDLYFIHGHEYSFPISNPVNPARGLFLRAQVHAACGHFHRTAHHSQPNLDQNLVSCWATGCLCGLHPDYRPINDWSHGFMFAEFDKKGAFAVENMRIVNGKAWR